MDTMNHTPHTPHTTAAHTTGAVGCSPAGVGLWSVGLWGFGAWGCGVSGSEVWAYGVLVCGVQWCGHPCTCHVQKKNQQTKIKNWHHAMNIWRLILLDQMLVNIVNINGRRQQYSSTNVILKTKE